MNIKEIIDAERKKWYAAVDEWPVNNMLDRIEAAVEQRIAELERPVEDDPSRVREDDGCPTENAVLRREWREMKQRIAELERPVEDADIRRTLVRLYNTGYKAGHHYTVEGVYSDIHYSDMDTYHEENLEGDENFEAMLAILHRERSRADKAEQRIAELEKQNIDLLEEVVDALQDVVFFSPRPTTTSAHADKVLPRYEQQLKKARGEV